MKEKVWYTLVRANGKWTVWRNGETMYKDHSSCGCRGIFSSESKKECLEYCKTNKIKITKGM